MFNYPQRITSFCFPLTAFEGNYWSSIFLQKQKESLQRSKCLTWFLMFAFKCE